MICILCRWICLFCSSALLCCPTLFAATGTATVSYTIGSITQIAFSGNPGTLTINSVTPGVGLNNAVDSSTSWALTTNLSSQKVTAQLSSSFPSGITLSINLTAPSGASSIGSVAINAATATTLVTGISNSVASGLTVTYTLAATVTAPLGSLSRTVTYTLSS